MMLRRCHVKIDLICMLFVWLLWSINPVSANVIPTTSPEVIISSDIQYVSTDTTVNTGHIHHDTPETESIIPTPTLTGSSTEHTNNTSENIIPTQALTGSSTEYTNNTSENIIPTQTLTGSTTEHTNNTSENNTPTQALTGSTMEHTNNTLENIIPTPVLTGSTMEHTNNTSENIIPTPVLTGLTTEHTKNTDESSLVQLSGMLELTVTSNSETYTTITPLTTREPQSYQDFYMDSYSFQSNSLTISESEIQPIEVYRKCGAILDDMEESDFHNFISDGSIFLSLVASSTLLLRQTYESINSDDTTYQSTINTDFVSTFDGTLNSPKPNDITIHPSPSLTFIGTLNNEDHFSDVQGVFSQEYSDLTMLRSASTFDGTFNSPKPNDETKHFSPSFSFRTTNNDDILSDVQGVFSQEYSDLTMLGSESISHELSDSYGYLSGSKMHLSPSSDYDPSRDSIEVVTYGGYLVTSSDFGYSDIGGSDIISQTFIPANTTGRSDVLSPSYQLMSSGSYYQSHTPMYNSITENSEVVSTHPSTINSTIISDLDIAVFYIISGSTILCETTMMKRSTVEAGSTVDTSVSPPSNDDSITLADFLSIDSNIIQGSETAELYIWPTQSMSDMTTNQDLETTNTADLDISPTDTTINRRWTTTVENDEVILGSHYLGTSEKIPATDYVVQETISNSESTQRPVDIGHSNTIEADVDDTTPPNLLSVSVISTTPLPPPTTASTTRATGPSHVVLMGVVFGVLACVAALLLGFCLWKFCCNGHKYKSHTLKVTPVTPTPTPIPEKLVFLSD